MFINQSLTNSRNPTQRTRLGHMASTQTSETMNLIYPKPTAKKNSQHYTYIAPETAMKFTRLDNSPKSTLYQSKTTIKSSWTPGRLNLQSRNLYWDYSPKNTSPKMSESRSQLTTKASITPASDLKTLSTSKITGADNKPLMTKGQNAIAVNLSTAQIKNKQNPLKKIFDTYAPEKRAKTEQSGLGLDNFQLDLVDLDCSMSNDDESRTVSVVLTDRDGNQFFSSILTQRQIKHQQTLSLVEEMFGIEDTSESALSQARAVYIFTSNSNMGRF